ncbi:MAG: glycosyltransferase [Bryobacteraceae bacterium]
MKAVLFYHSLRSDWNHGNAHFLRGIVSELIFRGCRIEVYEPAGGWSARNLIAQYGPAAVSGYQRVYPALASTLYDPETLDLDRALRGADLVLVHEWNGHTLVARIGEHRRRNPHYVLLFHDTHHRSVTAPEQMARYDLSHYDGVLAFGAVVGEIYRRNGWARRVWTWHEAADVRVFYPRPRRRGEPSADLVWIGNWGDGERAAELEEFLIQPVKSLRLRARVYGVRYAPEALAALADAGIEYGGWLPNYEAPEVFARHRLTIHVPRRPYTAALPGIPTIRPFEALACGIPLISAPWNDCENLFQPGRDFLVARDGAGMRRQILSLLSNPNRAEELAAHGRRTVLRRHTCGQRVDELLAVVRELQESPALSSPLKEMRA